MRANFSRQKFITALIVALPYLVHLTENSLDSVTNFGWMVIALMDRLQ
ncbi:MULTISPECIES: hypothetical protein [Enterobacteriaceae]|jgi:hypothetical protein|nr:MULTISPECIES: hypothetical protein [Enterobacteriaceae]HDS4384524.1 hypothetical protein [Klebsiella aerogenes]MDM2793481.1 hypothetical protein [Citrobacter sp. Cpo114]QLO96633.1 hypothetical protein HV047_02590 [Enterobacter hormaechei]VAG28668.1 Uncharacterised protein [Enterobacter hormaechei]VAM34888.1 Uncharacterised protein [Enterobacter hormaechei]